MVLQRGQMKDWMTIGRFAQLCGVSVKALRVYEERGLLASSQRGENGYRYYSHAQLEKMRRISQFKAMGFSLQEIRVLLDLDSELSPGKLRGLFEQRLENLRRSERDLQQQKDQIQSLLTSLRKNQPALGRQERKYIMSRHRDVLIVVTGIQNLEQTAQNLQELWGLQTPQPEIFWWKPGLVIRKPQILILPEKDLALKEVESLQPDIVVIQNLSDWNPEIEMSYLRLFSAVGPHQTTVFNADDRISVQLAGNPEIQKGRIFYYSKNEGLEDQIKKIGGVRSNGDEIKLFGFNLQPEVLTLKLSKPRSFDQEISLLAALTGLLDVGLNVEELQI